METVAGDPRTTPRAAPGGKCGGQCGPRLILLTPLTLLTPKELRP
jgi:hypothetical protein